MDRNKNELAMAQASRWYVRLRAADCTLAERLAFQEWLTQNPGHEPLYRRAREMAQQVDRLVAADPRLQALAAAQVSSQANAKPRERPRWLAAAALVIGVGLAAVLAVRYGEMRHANAPATARYANAGARQQVIELSDGSLVHLDVGSQLDVWMEKSARRLVLRSGRAYFEVAHDVTRPFSVSAGDSRTVALGTRFQVALDARGVSVTLAEGSIAITPVAAPDAWREILKPGQQLLLAATGDDRTMREVDAAAAIGWSSGRLVFKGTRLADALDEINRYAAVKLQLGDDSLGDVPIGGSFVAGGDSEQVVAALAAMLPLRAVHVGATEIVLFRRYETAIN